MRKTGLALLVCLLLTLLLPLSAAAEGQTPAERGLAAIAEAYNAKCIILPKEESYLDEWKVLYARKPWYQPNLTVESVPWLKSGAPRQAHLFEGTRVTVVAEQNDMSCILYPGYDNILRVGWIQSVRLLEEFPGERYTIGEASDGEYTTVDAVTQRWSDSFFLKTERRFVNLAEPVENCVGFTMEYQVTARNTGFTENVLGPRTLYLYDGESWTAVGSFPYDDLGAVQVEVRLDKPMKLVAFGTTAECEQPLNFDCRQIAYTFLTA